jgi:hypothetical protein
MSPIPIDLAVEDELSEAVLRRLLLHCANFYAVGTVYRRGGYGYLRKNIRGWNAAAKGRPFLLITDLDSASCPPSLIASWLPIPKHDNLLFRVAVREIEAWLLADAAGLASYFGVKPALLPTNPEKLIDPKQKLVELARLAKRKNVREDIVPRRGSTAKQGPGYNACLCAFVESVWNIEAAEKTAASLQRTLRRLSNFSPKWS